MYFGCINQNSTQGQEDIEAQPHAAEEHAKDQESVLLISSAWSIHSIIRFSKAYRDEYLNFTP